MNPSPAPQAGPPPPKGDVRGERPRARRKVFCQASSGRNSRLPGKTSPARESSRPSQSPSAKESSSPSFFREKSPPFRKDLPCVGELSPVAESEREGKSFAKLLPGEIPAFPEKPPPRERAPALRRVRARSKVLCQAFFQESGERGVWLDLPGGSAL